MISRYGQINYQKVIWLLLALMLLSLAAGPALAYVTPDETAQAEKLAPCATYEDMGVMGREGGLLSLLGIGGHQDPIPATIGTAGDFSLRAVQSESASYVVYARPGC
jgi:hypothetical protein